jgi:restriction system protein
MGTTEDGVRGAQFVQYLGPVLDALRALGGSAAPAEVVDRVAQDLHVPDDVQAELMPSGAPRFPNQVAWARFYLRREGLIDASKRGVWSLTEKGLDTHLAFEQSREIFLKWVRIYADARKERASQAAPQLDEEPSVVGDDGTSDHRLQLAALLHSLPAAGFERLCQRLLREAGFVEVVVAGRSGDGGIDGHGTLQVNPLVRFKVLFQCKRFKDIVSPSVVRDFRGAMQGRADKGIIMTTGRFTSEARREAVRDGVPPIELLDGERMIDLFTELELGLRPVMAYEIDEEFFDEFR